MDIPQHLILRDVRCFQGEQRARLRPITLLVGENSTGKTSFLGCYNVLHHVFSGPDIEGRLDFNEQPFAMGSFRDIVRARRGPSGRIEEFMIGLIVARAPRRGAPLHSLLATFREEGSQPVLSALRFDFDVDSFLELQRSSDGTVVQSPDHQAETSIPFGASPLVLDMLLTMALEERPAPPEAFENLRPVANHLRSVFARKGTVDSRRRRANGDVFRFWPPTLPPPIPIAPLRSKPKRTYDPVRETTSPEGEHIPMLMMRLNRTELSHWDSLHDDLVAFGREAGLFSDIKVKRHGKQMSDPFQLQVKVRTGPHASIVDVGYGVSQSLPILVDVMTAGEADRGGSRGRGTKGRSFLLQQPEVHLHPRGQAELANLFIEAFKKRGHRFLIETHSDYVVDRVRISVRKGLLKPDDVSILYFEPTGNAVTIHNLTLDKHGNLRDAPAGYRDFFVKETDRLLGFVD